MAKIGFISLGCAKNQVNCEQMMYRLQEAGHEILPDVNGADVVIINTCGFIDSAKSEAIDHIIAMGQLKQAGAVGKILVTGCLPQPGEAGLRVDGKVVARSVITLDNAPRMSCPWI